MELFSFAGLTVLLELQTILQFLLIFLRGVVDLSTLRTLEFNKIILGHIRVY